MSKVILVVDVPGDISSNTFHIHNLVNAVEALDLTVTESVALDGDFPVSLECILKAHSEYVQKNGVRESEVDDLELDDEDDAGDIALAALATDVILDTEPEPDNRSHLYSSGDSGYDSGSVSDGGSSDAGSSSDSSSFD